MSIIIEKGVVIHINCVNLCLTTTIPISIMATMEVYNAIFFINLIILAGIIVYDCFKKRKKAVICNVIVLSLFILLKLAQINYIAIRAGLFDLLGKEKFLALREVLSKVLFFSTSIMVGVELIIEIISIVLFIVVVARTAVILIEKASAKIFTSGVLPKDEKIEQNGIFICPSLYLVLEKLIC